MDLHLKVMTPDVVDFLMGYYPAGEFCIASCSTFIKLVVNVSQFIFAH